MVYLFLATGFEEVEALAPVDILRRADIEVQLISVTGEKVVTGSHGITVTADALFEETDFSDGELYKGYERKAQPFAIQNIEPCRKKHRKRRLCLQACCFRER